MSTQWVLRSLLLVALTLWVLPASIAAAPAAVDGVIDLRGWSPESEGPVALDGAWAFWWGELHDPAALDRLSKDAEAMHVPGIWKGVAFSDGSSVPNRGVATYRLKILLPPADRIPPCLFSWHMS